MVGTSVMKELNNKFIRSIFRTSAYTYDGAFLWNNLWLLKVEYFYTVVNIWQIPKFPLLILSERNPRKCFSYNFFWDFCKGNIWNQNLLSHPRNSANSRNWKMEPFRTNAFQIEISITKVNKKLKSRRFAVLCFIWWCKNLFHVMV